MSAGKTLHRSSTNRVIAGVCGGLGEYFEIDPILIRVTFILISILGGSGVLIYLVLWLIMPSDSGSHKPEESIKNNLNEMKSRAEKFASDFKINKNTSDSKSWWGLLLLIIGVLILLNNFGIYSSLEIGRFWPVILIIFGLSLLSRRN